MDKKEYLDKYIFAGLTDLESILTDIEGKIGTVLAGCCIFIFS